MLAQAREIEALRAERDYYQRESDLGATMLGVIVSTLGLGTKATTKAGASVQDVLDHVAALRAEVEMARIERDLERSRYRAAEADVRALAEALLDYLACKHGDENTCGCRDAARTVLAHLGVVRAQAPDVYEALDDSRATMDGHDG